jgi:2'-5' RNA ligase
MIRTFIALDLPPNVQEALEGFARELKKADAPVAWVKPDRIHLTLKFLGDVQEERIPEIREVLEKIAASTEPLTLKASGCGAFPTMKEMRVVWVGLVGGHEALGRLARRIEEALVPFGFKREGRPFKPHLTLGRVKGRQHLRALQEILLVNQDFEAEAFDVTEVVLYKSDLRPDGARYTPLYRAVFAGRSE